MKVFIAPFVVLAFLGVSIFGFAALHNGLHDGGCLASTLGGGVCASSSDGFGFASFHLNAFKIFSNATLELALAVLALLLIAGVLVFWGGTRFSLLNPGKIGLFRPVVRIVDSGFRRWLTVLEKRDPAPNL